RIVRNTCHTMRRSSANAAASMNHDDLSVEIALDAPAPDELLVRKEDAQTVRNAIEELPTEFREAIVLRELEGLSYAEIAKAAGVRIGTVMSRLARGRQRLFECLRRRAPSADAIGGVR